MLSKHLRKINGGEKMKSKLFGILVLLGALSIVIPSFCYGDEISLMFPKPWLEQKTSDTSGRYVMSRSEKSQEYSEIKLLKFVEQFEKAEYKVEQIELWIEAKAESKGITQFFVSIAGSGGCKVILKPKSGR